MTKKVKKFNKCTFSYSEDSDLSISIDDGYQGVALTQLEFETLVGFFADCKGVKVVIL